MENILFSYPWRKKTDCCLLNCYPDYIVLEARTSSHASSLSVSLKLNFKAQNSITFAQVSNISVDKNNIMTSQLN
jgi:hypothetical protein